MRSSFVIRGIGQSCRRKRGVRAVVKNLVSGQIMTPREKCERKRAGGVFSISENYFYCFVLLEKYFQYFEVLKFALQDHKRQHKDFWVCSVIFYIGAND